MAPPEVVSTKPCPLVPALRERPILFSAPMVRAVLDGTKTQTRRVVKLPHENPLGKWEALPWGGPNGGRTRSGETLPAQMVIGHSRTGDILGCPYGQPGDRLWVRETHFAFGRWETRYSAKKRRDEWHFVDMTLECGHAYLYDADHPRPQPLAGKRDGGVTPKWWKRPAIFMPRAASRIALEVAGVRVERLQEISETDAVAEGCKAEPFPGPWWQGYKRMPDGELVHQQATGESPPDWMVEPHRMRDMSSLNRSAKDAFQTLWGQINGPDSWTSNPWVWVIAFQRLASQHLSSINGKESP